jgi:hypothetical protein
MERDVPQDHLQKWLPGSKANSASALRSNSLAIFDFVLRRQLLHYAETSVGPERAQRTKARRITDDGEQLGCSHLSDVWNRLQEFESGRLCG